MPFGRHHKLGKEGHRLRLTVDMGLGLHGLLGFCEKPSNGRNILDWLQGMPKDHGQDHLTTFVDHHLETT